MTGNPHPNPSAVGAIIAVGALSMAIGLGLGFVLGREPDRQGLDEIACQAATGFAASRAREWLDGAEPEVEVEP